MNSKKEDLNNKEFNIEENLKYIPKLPGVYLMKDSEGQIIYVGKAINLKNRVRQYFRKNDRTKRVDNMVSNIYSFEYIVTDTEDEALILESNLIKLHMPKFNVLLKDDKSYPYIKLDMKSEYPYISFTRRKNKDGSKYFGPYPSASQAKMMIDLIKEKYPLRLCKNFRYRTRPCIYYQMGMCLAPCIKGKISREEYFKIVSDVQKILSGDTKVLEKALEQDMKRASEKKEYEKAAELRDKIYAVKRVSQKQKISNFAHREIDAIAMARNELEINISIFCVRESKLQEKKEYILENRENLTDEEVLISFVKQKYLNNEEYNIPNKIMLKYYGDEREVLEKNLSAKAERKIQIIAPQRGEKLRFIEMAETNSKISLENRTKNKLKILNELKEVLELNNIPKRIEIYDISNIAGSNTVSAMVVVSGGQIDKRATRRFKLEEITTQNDVLAMKHTIRRRVTHNIEGKKGLGDLPDIIIADGGINQINAIKEEIAEIIKELNQNQKDKRLKEYIRLLEEIKVYGLVKDDKHRTKQLIDSKMQIFNISDYLKNFLTNMQDEVHMQAVGYHIKRRDSLLTRSILDEIKGIGKKKKEELYKKFGSIENIKKASVSEIAETKGINEKLAHDIKNKLNELG